MNRAEYRRQQRQQDKSAARYTLTQGEIEQMVKEALQRERKRMIEEYNAEFIARDAETKNKMINLIHRLWLHGLGEFGITDRDLTFNLDQYVKNKFRELSDCIEMNDHDRAREMLSQIGVPAEIIGLAEKHWRADPNDDIVFDIEDE